VVGAGVGFPRPLPRPRGAVLPLPPLSLAPLVGALKRTWLFPLARGAKVGRVVFVAAGAPNGDEPRPRLLLPLPALTNDILVAVSLCLPGHGASSAAATLEWWQRYNVEAVFRCCCAPRMRIPALELYATGHVILPSLPAFCMCFELLHHSFHHCLYQFSIAITVDSVLDHHISIVIVHMPRVNSN
jgi:hypothetical protein